MLVISKKLICNLCGAYYGETDHLTGRTQRQMAERDGWVYIGRKDFCPVCTPNKALNSERAKSRSELVKLKAATLPERARLAHHYIIFGEDYE